MIQIKMLSGDLVEVSVTEDVTFSRLYQEVYRALPEEIRPRAIWQLSLTRQTLDGEYEEIPDTEERVNPQEGEIFCAMMDTRMVEASRGRTYDAYDEDADAAIQDEYLYELNVFQIMSEKANGGIEDIMEDSFLYHPSTGRYYLTTNVDGKWIGRFGDEFSFQFLEEKEDGFGTVEEMLDVWLANLDGYANRTKEYLKKGWVKFYDPYQEEEDQTAEEWDQEEAQREAFEEDMRRWG